MAYSTIQSSRLALFFKEHLNEVDGVSFTPREVDVISCVVHNRGDKKIATILTGINYRTISSHIRNITNKIAAHSREEIIDFVEKSGKMPIFRQYYAELIKIESFLKKLQKIASFYNRQGLIFETNINPKNHSPKFKELITLLKLCNIELKYPPTNNNDSDFYIVKQEAPDQRKIHIVISPTTGRNKISSPVDRNFNLSSGDKFFDNFFALIELIFSEEKKDISALGEEFKQEVQIKNLDLKANEERNYTLFHLSLSNKQKYLILLASSIIILLAIFIFFYSSQRNNLSYINYHFSIEDRGAHLKRDNLIKKIDEKLAMLDGGLKTIIIEGISGSGKTTLVKSYLEELASNNFVWLVDCSSQKKMINNLEALVYASCQSENDFKRKNHIIECDNLDKKEKMIFAFLKEKIPLYSPWIFVIENLHNIEDMAAFKIFRENFWGRGKIFITTNNSQITNNTNLTAQNIIKIPPLSDKECLLLYSKYARQKISSLSKTELASLNNFLQKLPPYPQDLESAARYIKNKKCSYEEYLKLLSSCSQEFNEETRKLYNNNIKDIATRADQITYYLDIIGQNGEETNKLLTLVVLSGNLTIPYSFLSYLTSNSQNLDELIKNLATYSLIKTGIASKTLPKNIKFQPGIYPYIKNFMLQKYQISKKGALQKELSKVVLNFLKIQLNKTNPCYQLNIKEEDKTLINRLIPICHNLIRELRLAPPIKKAKILQQLSKYEILNYHNNNTTIIGNLLKTNEIFKQQYGKIHKLIAENYDLLGRAHYNNRDFNQAKHFFRKSIKLYKNFYHDSHPIFAAINLSLTKIYIKMGELNKAKEYFAACKTCVMPNRVNHSIFIIQQAKVYEALGDNNKALEIIDAAIRFYELESPRHLHLAWAQAIKAKLLLMQGHNLVAQKLLNKARPVYVKHFGENHRKVAWLGELLAQAYNNLGEYQSALKILQKTENTYKKEYGKSHILLKKNEAIKGSILLQMGQINKANEIIENSLSECQIFYGDNNYECAGINLLLAKSELAKGNYDVAMELINSAKKIYVNHFGQKHLYLARINLMLGKVAMAKNNHINARAYLNKAIALYENNNNKWVLFAYEALANLNIKEAKLANKPKTNLNIEATQLLKKALIIANNKEYFSDLHAGRIKNKIGQPICNYSD